MTTASATRPSLAAWAQISRSRGKTAIIDGVQTLRGCEVRACDLRAGAAMVIAAMCAEGMTLIEDAHFIERGYEDIVGKLTALGAHIRRIETYETPSVSEDAG